MIRAQWLDYSNESSRIVESKQEEKSIDLKCTCGKCGCASGCSCDDASDWRSNEAAGARDFGGTVEAIGAATDIGESAGTAEAIAATTDTGESAGTAEAVAATTDTGESVEAIAAATDTVEAARLGSETHSASECASHIALPSPVYVEPPIKFPPPSRAALTRWVISAAFLCGILLMLGTVLMKWSPRPWKLALQESYAAHDRNDPYPAEIEARRALFVAKAYHAPYSDKRDIYRQLYLLFAEQCSGPSIVYHPSFSRIWTLNLPVHSKNGPVRPYGANYPAEQDYPEPDFPDRQKQFDLAIKTCKEAAACAHEANDYTTEIEFFKDAERTMKTTGCNRSHFTSTLIELPVSY